jgi:hypothetical protein
MTTQYAVIDGLPTGLTLTAKLFDMDTPDTELVVDDIDINEGANAKGRYVMEVTNSTALSGDYTTRLFVGSVPIAVADRRFAGTDGETGQPLPIAVELDSSVTDLLNDIPTTAEFEARTLAAANYATASQINSLQVNTRASVQVPVEIETPDSGTQVWKIRLFLFDSDGNMEAPDSTPTVALVNAAGTDRSSRLSAATTLSTGAYSWDYTSTDDDAEEQLNWTFTVVEGGLTRIYPATSYVVEETAYRFTSTDRSTLNSRASSTEIAAVSTKLGTPAGASMSADIASVKTDTGTAIPGLFTTLTTKIRKYIQLLFRKDAAIATDNATELTELNANGGSGAGSASNTTDSLEAIRDRGDSAWTTGGGGGGGSDAAVMVSTTIATLSSQTVFTLTAGSADNDVYNDQLVVITDAVTSTQKARMLVSDYVGSTKTLTLASAPGFTIAVGDSITIIAVAGLTAGQRNQLALIGAGTRMTVKADLGTSIALKIGDTYAAARSTAKRIDVNDSDSSIYDMLTGDEVASIDFGVSNAKTIDVVTGTVDPETVSHTAASGSVSAYTTVYVEVEVDKALSPFCGDYDIQITYDDETRRTPFGGKCELVRDFKA